MNRAVLVDGTNIDGFLSKYNVITCKLRNSRIKSKRLGIMEMLLSNYDLDIIFIKNGPLSDVKGIVSFFVKKENHYIIAILFLTLFMTFGTLISF